MNQNSGGGSSSLLWQVFQEILTHIEFENHFRRAWEGSKVKASGSLDDLMSQDHLSSIDCLLLDEKWTSLLLELLDFCGLREGSLASLLKAMEDFLASQLISSQL